MKTLLVLFDNEDYEKLKIAKEKSGKTWRNFLLSLVEKDENKTN